jgi:hypothetical protein
MDDVVYSGMRVRSDCIDLRPNNDTLHLHIFRFSCCFMNVRSTVVDFIR